MVLTPWMRQIEVWIPAWASFLEIVTHRLFPARLSGSPYRELTDNRRRK